MNLKNNLNNLRDIKFLNKLKEAGDFGFFACDLARALQWKEIAVKSVAGSLSKRGHVNIAETSKGWYICFLSDLENEVRSEEDNRVREEA